MGRFVAWHVMGCGLLCLALGSPISQAANPPLLQESATVPSKVATEHLPNVIRLHSRVYSGGLPEGDAAFEELSELGIRTILSVDGAKPDVAQAERHGLRYVHLPHGYSGIPETRVLELAKAVAELDGPIYVHCHHGKHRSPAAASAACVTAGLLPASEAVSVLKLAGTSPGYRGLFRSVQAARPVDGTRLADLPCTFQAIVPVPPMAEAMVDLEHTYANLVALSQAEWRAPDNHPDLDAQHEALLLREHYTELLRTEAVQNSSAAFKQSMLEAQSLSQQLEDTLQTQAARRTRAGADQANSLNQANSQGTLSPQVLLGKIEANCRTCHVRFRDNVTPPATP